MKGEVDAEPLKCQILHFRVFLMMVHFNLSIGLYSYNSKTLKGELNVLLTPMVFQLKL